MIKRVKVGTVISGRFNPPRRFGFSQLMAIGIIAFILGTFLIIILGALNGKTP